MEEYLLYIAVAENRNNHLHKNIPLFQVQEEVDQGPGWRNIYIAVAENRNVHNVHKDKFSTISLFLTNSFVTSGFAIASSVAYSEIRQNFFLDLQPA